MNTGMKGICVERGNKLFVRDAGFGLEPIGDPLLKHDSRVTCIFIW